MTPHKTAVVSGSNRGIGLEIARQLALRGVEVMITARDATAAEKTCAELTDEGLNVHACQLDVTSEKSILNLSEAVEQQWNQLDILVNNAGIFIDRSFGVMNIELDAVRATMETNLYGPLRLSQALFPLMKKSASPRIINLSSGLGALHDMGAGYVAYSISKTALNALTRKLSGELQSYGFLVNSMCPGWVQTEMGGPGATRSVEQGADTAVWLALDAVNQTGCFFRDRQIREW
jgi:short-subunit dehydrogenase